MSLSFPRSLFLSLLFFRTLLLPLAPSLPSYHLFPPLTSSLSPWYVFLYLCLVLFVLVLVLLDICHHFSMFSFSGFVIVVSRSSSSSYSFLLFSFLYSYLGKRCCCYYLAFVFSFWLSLFHLLWSLVCFHYVFFALLFYYFFLSYLCVFLVVIIKRQSA